MSLIEFIIDDHLKTTLLKDAKLALWSANEFVTFSLYEELGRFPNYAKAISKVAKHLGENVDEDDIQHQRFIIDVSDCDIYCKKVDVEVFYGDSLGGDFYKFEDDTAYIKLMLNESFKVDIDILEGIILHEMLHAYEEHNRLAKGKLSIFDEISKEYMNARRHLRKPFEPDKSLSTLKYYLDPKERNAFFATLTMDIKRVAEKVKPSLSQHKINDMIEGLQSITTWERYFEFCKFAMRIDTYEDEDLERAYWRVVASREEHKANLTNKDKQYIKSAKEIRKEVKAKHILFNKKFNQLFIKIYSNYLKDDRD